ncbi:MAG: hypothetical protein K5930_09990 [Treponemataceae bacterium]|nr:hypothetical protein [Treponemataceae bacterium]
MKGLKIERVIQNDNPSFFEKLTEGVARAYECKKRGMVAATTIPQYHQKA